MQKTSEAAPVDFEPTLDFALEQDKKDPLRLFRNRFYFPKIQEKEAIYFCGNSLGLQPKSVEEALLKELEQWRMHGVEGHFEGEMPWMHYHKFLLPQTAQVVGAKEEEVVVMNTLTTNLHLMMVSFYRPAPGRFKIIVEAGAFPSDQYAIESQVRWHGFTPEEAIVEVAPRPGEMLLRQEDIEAIIAQHGRQTALVLFGGVNYFTGQFFDLKAIAEAAHRAGAYVGFDLAHAAGNMLLKLHDWQVDFAVWCSYKYLNSGPGGPGGVFVHEQHGKNPGLPRFAGWWGHDENERFQMRKGFKPMPGAAGWQLSNAQVLACAAHKASLDIFAEATMPALRGKSERLTGFLAYLIDRSDKEFAILTPEDKDQRGCQLSIYVSSDGKGLFDYLHRNNVICDWREDNLSATGGGVIRVAPVPLYNTFAEVWQFAQLLEAYSG
ncbi:MAG TPA: kynureninase [Flavilitoribacter sp.]|nr:kynureninase [Flavilitoribacter sp.]HMQ86231.1 kynureninase [Flavilitoribacter sp.]